MKCEDKHQFDKSPGGKLDYQFDWAEWLGTDKLLSATFNVDQGLGVEGQSHTATAATVWLSNGQPYATYQVRCSVVTEGGRTDKRTAALTIKHLAADSASRVYHIPADPDRVDLSPEGPHYG